MLTSDKAVYREALRQWGAEAQVFMVFEEASELQKELCKFYRGRASVENISEEIADVEIMLDQMKVFFRNEDIVEKKRSEKMSRLRKILKFDKYQTKLTDGW